MNSWAVRYLNNTWKRARQNRNWPYLALLAFIVLPLLWLAYSMAVRSRMFELSGAPDSKQVEIFLTFIGGGLATAATLFAALFTRDHNLRERQRLRLETVIKSLDSLPAQTPRAAAVLPTMVLLGQQRIAMRVLAPAWESGEVDHGTATWLVGQVLTGGGTHGDSIENNHRDEIAINEAATLLATHANQLTVANTAGMYYFPGHFQRQWSTDQELPEYAKSRLLLAMGTMLTSRDRGWWCPRGDPPEWPTAILLECAKSERVRSVKLSASVLLAALNDCFPEQFKGNLDPNNLKSILKRANEAKENPASFSDYLSLADKIRSDWGASQQPETVVQQ